MSDSLECFNQARSNLEIDLRKVLETSWRELGEHGRCALLDAFCEGAVPLSNFAESICAMAENNARGENMQVQVPTSPFRLVAADKADGLKLRLGQIREWHGKQGGHREQTADPLKLFGGDFLAESESGMSDNKVRAKRLLGVKGNIDIATKEIDKAVMSLSDIKGDIYIDCMKSGALFGDSDIGIGSPPLILASLSAPPMLEAPGEAMAPVLEQSGNAEMSLGSSNAEMNLYENIQELLQESIDESRLARESALETGQGIAASLDGAEEMLKKLSSGQDSANRSMQNLYNRLADFETRLAQRDFTDMLHAFANFQSMWWICQNQPKSGHYNISNIITNFIERFLMSVSKVGLRAVRPSIGAEFNPEYHEADTEPEPGERHKIAEVKADGFTFNNLLVLKPYVKIMREEAP
jgi:molecular chaperone GrpE (heat shock protein)